MRRISKWMTLVCVLVTSFQIVRGDQTITGNLIVTNTGDFEGTTLGLGADGGSPGIQLTYTDGSTSTLTFNATRSANIWEWQQNAGGTVQTQMSLSSGNTLTLYNGSSTAEIVLNPLSTSTFSTPVTFNGAVTLNGAINATASLGIGTGSPSTLLDVEGSAIGELTIGSSNTTGNAILLNNSSTGAHNYQLYITGSGGGSTGLGTFGIYDSTTTSSPFAVYGGTSGTAGQYIATTANSLFGFSSSTSAATTPDTGISRYAADKLAIGNGTAGDRSGTLLAAGINIGTTTNVLPLTVVGNSTSGSVSLQNYNSAGFEAVDVFNNTGTKCAGFGWGNSGSGTFANLFYFNTVVPNSLVFGTNTAERMRITSTGSIGINTKTPATTLEVNGTAQVDGTLRCLPGGDLAMGSFTAGTAP